MNITVSSVGAKIPNWVNEIIGEHSKRFEREINYVLKEIKPEKRDLGMNAEQGMAAEEERILEAIPQGAYLVVLDERSKAPILLGPANYLKIWMQDGDHVRFVIGGMDGMTEELK